MTNADKPLTNH